MIVCNGIDLTFQFDDLFECHSMELWVYKDIRCDFSWILEVIILDLDSLRSSTSLLIVERIKLSAINVFVLHIVQELLPFGIRLAEVSNEVLDVLTFKDSLLEVADLLE